MMRFRLFFGVLLSLLLPTGTLAQAPADIDVGVSAEVQLEAALPELPAPGLTPSSPLFIFEQLIENVRDALTFDPEAKARRQEERALERIAEVKAMLADKGVAPRGLDIALRKIEEHAQKAAANAQDPSLAKKVNTTLESQKILLKKIIEEKKNRLREEHKERKQALHRQLTEHLLTHADDQADALEKEIDQTDAQNEESETLLDDALDATEDALDAQEKTLEQALDEEERQQKEFERSIRTARKEKKKALHAHLKELHMNLKEKEHALREQLKEAIKLGEDDEIEQLTESLTSTTPVDASIETDIQAALSVVTSGEASVETSFIGKNDVDVDVLMARERVFLDHLAEGADRLLQAKNKVRELSLVSQKKALELKGKRLGNEIVKRREECLSTNTANLGRCIAERARDLQRELEDTAVKEKVVEEEQANLSDESSAEERRFDADVMMRRQALETLRTLKDQPDRLVGEAQKLSERAQEAQKEWQGKIDSLKEERRNQEEDLRQRIKEGKEVIRTEWKDFLNTDFSPEELKAMQEKRRVEQHDLLDQGKEERAGVREKFKEGMRDVKEERGMMKEEMKEERQMMKDEAAEERSEKQRMKEEEMRGFMDTREALLKEQRREADRMMKEREQMMQDKTSGDKKILPPSAVPPPPDRLNQLPPVKPLLPRYPSRDVPDRRPDNSEYYQRPDNDRPPPSKRPADEQPPPTKRSDDRDARSGGASFEGRGEATGEVKSDGEGARGGVQFEFEGKGEAEMNKGR